MALYYYRGRQTNGRKIKGEINADSTQQAASQLKENGITPIEIEETTEKGSWFRSYMRQNLYKVTNEELNTFCRQMYALLHASIPIDKALRKVVDGTRNPLLREALFDINRNIMAGQSLNQSLRQYPNIFSKVFVNTIAAGETGGRLEEAFFELSRFLSFESKAQKQFKSALRYPTIVIMVLIGALVVMSIFVIPQFASLFDSLNTELPLPTRMIIGLSQFIVNNGLLLLIILLALIMGSRIYFTTDSGRYKLHKWLLSMPIFGRLVYQVLVARFARIFTILYQSGVPLNNTLELTAEAINNDYLTAKIYHMIEQIRKGENLSNAAIASGLLPPLAIQMIQSGEESGMLEQMLGYIAEYYEQEVDYDLSRIEDLMTPIIIIILGIMVLVLALGVFLPIWNAISQIGAR